MFFILASIEYPIMVLAIFGLGWVGVRAFRKIRGRKEMIDALTTFSDKNE